MSHDLLSTPRQRASRSDAREPARGRVLIVSNRLPVTLVEDGPNVITRASDGGLATGLRGVQRQYGSNWIGWTGLSNSPNGARQREIDWQLRSNSMIPIHLTRNDVDRFYHRFANGVLWPLLHGVAPAMYDKVDWETYRAVNARFADAIVRELNVGDVVWIHDYHLMLVPRLVRERCPWAKIGFFLHTPFPEPESFVGLPQAALLLDGMVGSDAVGLHTDEYVRNAIAAVSAMGLYRAHHNVVTDCQRPVAVFSSPMSIDTADFNACASAPGVSAEAARLRGSGPLFVGVDRLDYTKGLPERLRAFEGFLERDSSMIGRARLIQVAVPSRESLDSYRQVRSDVEAIVRRINDRWATAEWTPVDYRYRSIERLSMIALYRAADVMLVTPLRDGMNLVAKEFVASRVDNDGVLILSERAGAAAELRTALLVDPTNEDAMAEAYGAAVSMLPAERRVRMRHMRLRVAAHSVRQWADSVLGVLGVPGAGTFYASRA